MFRSGCITVVCLDCHLYACPCFLSKNTLYLPWPVRIEADGRCPLTPLAYIRSRVAWIWRRGGVTKQPPYHVQLLESVPDILPCGFHCIQSIVMWGGKKVKELVLMQYASVLKVPHITPKQRTELEVQRQFSCSFRLACSFRIYF